MAAAAADWPSLAVAVRGCTACPELVATRQQVVVGEPATVRGARQVVLVGEAPGAQEDQTGRPFVGKAGAMLDALLRDIGLPRDRVAVVNVLKCRPPENRPPRPAEVARCRPWLQRQLDLLAPDVVVAMGLTAVTWFLGTSTGPRLRLGDARGKVHVVDGRRVLATYHPSAAIRFGPRGAPMAALRDDLAAAVRLVNAR